jgi:hypothetical protein
MKNLVDENLIAEKYLLNWFDKEVRLDKESILYDKSAESKFRKLIEVYIEWLKNASSGSSGSSTDEEKKEEPQKEEDEEEDEDDDDKEDDDQIVSAPKETEAQKKQKELIEKQKKV